MSNMSRNKEHTNAERSIFSTLIQTKEFILNSTKGFEIIPIESVDWFEGHVPDSNKRGDMVIYGKNGNTYILEIVNTNRISKEKKMAYLNQHLAIGIYIDIKNIIFAKSLEEQFEAVSKNVKDFGFSLIE